jgi:hypothetical protein
MAMTNASFSKVLCTILFANELRNVLSAKGFTLSYSDEGTCTARCIKTNAHRLTPVNANEVQQGLPTRKIIKLNRAFQLSSKFAFYPSQSMSKGNN